MHRHLRMRIDAGRLHFRIDDEPAANSNEFARRATAHKAA
jgi:hypothetical protein